MPSNLGFEITYRGNGVNIPLYPQTVIDQVVGWDVGSVYGPYTISLLSENWVNKSQTVSLDGVISTDRVNCIKILTGSQEEMEIQELAYGLLDLRKGIQSLNNQVKFTCTDETPNIDIQVQVFWTR